MTEQTSHNSPPKVRPTQWWQRVARRIRVPLGISYRCRLSRRGRSPRIRIQPRSHGVLRLFFRDWLCARLASGTVKKNQELSVTGPYAYTRNPLYLGSTLIAAGFAVALLSWPLALLLAVGFAAIYIPVIASEEQFLRAAFPEFDNYCRTVPRFIPRLTPARLPRELDLPAVSQPVTKAATGGFSFALYLKHREYNSALGAALLYLSLLYLRPVLEILLHRAW